jgi:hypothetical protein
MTSDQIETTVSLAYRTHSSVGAGKYRDADDYILSLMAEIVGYAGIEQDKKTEREIQLGELRLYLIRVGNAVNDGVRLFDVFDSYQETHDASAALYESSYGDFSPSVRKRFEEAFCCDDILLLHYLTLKPFARGQRLGLAVMERAMRDWSSGCSLVVIKPFPLQFESSSNKLERDIRLSLNNFSGSKTEAFRRLRMYYQQLGFERIGRSEFYALCPNERLPDREKLGLPDCIGIPQSAIEQL